MIQIDMEMPKCCSECDFEIFNGSTDECLFVYNGYTDKIRTFKRLDACPLHEVTADPDTVSRQAVIELIQGSICDLEYSDENMELCDKVRALPPSPTQSRPQIYCKDCKWHFTYHDQNYNVGYELCGNPKMMIGDRMIDMSSADYCSNAEPKEGGAV